MPDYGDVEEALEARIAAVDAAPFAQGGVASLRPSSIPLSSVQDSSQLAHLLFDVAIASAPSGGGTRGATRDADAIQRVRARVVVTFCYNLRPNRQKRDQRAASNLAARITRAVLADSADELGQGEELESAYGDGLRPFLTPDGSYLVVEMEHFVAFDLSL